MITNEEQTVLKKDTRCQITLVDRCGEKSVNYTPLAIMYLKASLMRSQGIVEKVNVDLFSFNTSDSITYMIENIMNTKPSIVGFSCQGWNYKQFMSVIHTIKQMDKNIRIVLGGNHVSYRGEELLRQNPLLDFVVNGEGEETFVELIDALVDGRKEFSHIKGLTFRTGSGESVTTEQRARNRDLSTIASPYLESDFGSVKYDVALLETNRGCPYHCSFCYWGGAVGQKLARGTLERVRDELKVIAMAQIPTIFICDANFGILKEDVEIARLIVEMKEKYGYPQYFHVNWAKNHAQRVKEISSILKNGGIQSNLYLALQTINKTALSLADRNEVGRADMFELAKEMINRGEDVGCELIFGLPGEPLSDFLTNYDILYWDFPKLLVHPLWILPNTKYSERREELGIVTIQPDQESAYEGILYHNTLSLNDNREGLAFLLGEDILIGNTYARSVIRGISTEGTYSPSMLIQGFEWFVHSRTDGLSKILSGIYRSIRKSCYFFRDYRNQVKRALFNDSHESLLLLKDYINQLVLPESFKNQLCVLAKYDCSLLPRSDLNGEGVTDMVVTFPFNVHLIVEKLLQDQAWPTEAIHNSGQTEIVIRHKQGYEKFANESIDLSSEWSGKVIHVHENEESQNGY